LVSQIAYSQSDSLNGYKVFYYPGGQKSSEGFLREGKPDGYWRSYYENGFVKSEGTRNNFLLDSIWKFYYNTGDLHQVISYRNDQKNGYTLTYTYEKTNNNDSAYFLKSKELFLNGIRQGESFYYYPNGNLQFKVYYRNDKRHGKGKELNESGQVISLFEYFNGYLIENTKINRLDANNIKQGRWIDFFQHGEIKTDVTYLNGKYHGYYREYNEKGELLKEIRYLNGEPVTRDVEEELRVKADVRTVYHENGKPKYIGAFLEGKPVGIHREYNTDGFLIMAQQYDDFSVLQAQGLFDDTGNKTGKWTLFYESGKILGTGNYKNDLRDGEWYYYYENGSTEQKGNYKNDKPDGYWVWYYPSGKILREENYLDGKREGDVAEYDENGNYISKGSYFDGLKTGDWYYNVGDHTEEGAFENGYKNGVWKYYYPDKRISFEGEFRGGDPIGAHYYYYADGTVALSGKYKTGKKHKKWKKFNSDGSLFLVYTYKNGKIVEIDGKKIKEADAGIYKEEQEHF
jgi:antitoxin component YwqK of YwqJK toxin-antitoxin module